MFVGATPPAATKTAKRRAAACRPTNHPPVSEKTPQSLLRAHASLKIATSGPSSVVVSALHSVGWKPFGACVLGAHVVVGLFVAGVCCVDVHSRTLLLQIHAQHITAHSTHITPPPHLRAVLGHDDEVDARVGELDAVEHLGDAAAVVKHVGARLAHGHLFLLCVGFGVLFVWVRRR